MPDVVRRALQPDPGMKSTLAGLFLWQLEDLSRQLIEDVRGATPEELGWQPEPGMNTIGMLLAHIAVVETSWIHRGLKGLDDLAEGSLPIGRAETGMPLPKRGGPPAFLNGKDLAFFEDLLARSRANTRRELAALTDADLERRIRRRPRPETEYELSLGWILYHILEHEAGHYYQVKLLRHLYRSIGPHGTRE